MSRLLVLPIVEGHGEDAAIRVLLDRVWREIAGGEYLNVLKPIRAKRDKLVKAAELDRLIELGVLKLRSVQSQDRSIVLVLIDADKDCPAELSGKLTETARNKHSNADVVCVIAKIEYETWFVAAAGSLKDYLELRDGDPPSDPERAGAGKGWISARFMGTKYSPTIDQPRLTARMDLNLCRQRSPSFDKLCRELEKRCGGQH